jgi:hypothetical protein
MKAAAGSKNGLIRNTMELIQAKICLIFSYFRGRKRPVLAVFKPFGLF